MPRRPDRPFGADPEELDSVDALIEYAVADDPQPVDKAVEEYRGRHRREVPKSTMRARLRKAFRRFLTRL